MTPKEKVKLIKQAGKLYTLGLTVERRREKLRRLVEKKVPYDSPQMKQALSEFETADEGNGNGWSRNIWNIEHSLV